MSTPRGKSPCGRRREADVVVLVEWLVFNAEEAEIAENSG
jgi:hypothetical protein